MIGIEAVRTARLIFWDFDGVIKDSVQVKTEAFVRLFESYGSGVAEQVLAHHEANGGMSRFEKLPLYLRWAGQEPTEERVNGLSERFGHLVRQGVIDSPWVPGVEAYLRSNPHHQIFILVSATPQDELEQIVRTLDLRDCFEDVFGAPLEKMEAIRMTLSRRNFLAEDSLMIGDARADLDAAAGNRVPFVLRRHATNAPAFADYEGLSLCDLIDDPRAIPGHGLALETDR